MKKSLLLLLFCALLTKLIEAEEIIENGDYNITIDLEIEPSYSIIIPSSVDLLNEETNINYYVKANIYNHQYVSVLFEADQLYCEEKDLTIPLSLVQETSEYTSCDDYLEQSISISHPKLQAGSWSGSMKVSISLKDEQI